MKKIVKVWAFYCPKCGRREYLPGLHYFSRFSTPVRPILGPTDSFPYECDGAALNISGSQLVLLEREIDYDEPLWATSSLLDKVRSLKERAEFFRAKEPNSVAWQAVADICDEQANEILQVAHSGTGQQKVDVLYNS